MKLWNGLCAVAVSLAMLGWAGTLCAQTTPRDPWSRVPATPTSFFGDDDFINRVEKTQDAVNADVSRQRAINEDVKNKYAAMDMGEKMQRMQAYMQKNPQEAMKMMQAMQGAGTAVTGNVISADANVKKLQQELDADKTNFNAAVDKAVNPIHVREQDMIKTRTQPRGEGGLEFKTAADLAQFSALVKQENAEYEKASAPFFEAKGTFATWLTNYKEQVVKKTIAAGETVDSSLVAQMAIMDSPAGGYRSTAALEGVRDYLLKLKEVYALRRRANVMSNFAVAGR